MKRASAARAWVLVLLPVLGVSTMHSQTPRLRGLDHVLPPETPAQAAPVQPSAVTPVPQPAAPTPPAAAATPQTSPEPAVPPSMLQQPAQPAQIVFEDENLSIKANNSSLSEILHEIAAKSGMKVEGLGTDERVFGSFGPGAPRDVLADLLNGTAYDQVLLGDLSDGAPRELILTPATHGGPAAAAAPSQVAEEETEPETQETPLPQPEPQQPASATQPPTPGVRTPQQIFEQLQRMRQGQGQQQQPVQQDSPLQ
ncbi:MAG TPA: hypothetical protein VMB49_20450 [Acidobacteriaceae bacterium]|nr:hypothetical protein [Acidobacteriaceae bacterium]